MRRCFVFLCFLLLICGCSSQQTYETLSDEMVTQVMAEPMDVLVELPEGMNIQAANTNGSAYFGEGYSICIQTFAAGDLEKTLRECTGFDKERLDILETKPDGLARYETVWSCIGENGDQVGRIVILDDGKYHYTLTLLADAVMSDALRPILQPVCASFRLIEPGEKVNSGS